MRVSIMSWLFPLLLLSLSPPPLSLSRAERFDTKEDKARIMRERFARVTVSRRIFRRRQLRRAIIRHGMKLYANDVATCSSR